MEENADTGRDGLFAALHADAAWAGWGFVAERPDFVDLCTRLGVHFIRPVSGAMRRLGDKVCAKRLEELRHTRHAQAESSLPDLRPLVLGFNVDPVDARTLCQRVRPAEPDAAG